MFIPANWHKIASLKPRHKMAYNSWIEGYDLRATLPKNTFYRYRKEMMEHGIDIAVSKANDRAKPIPIIDVVLREPVQTPQWALGTDIYFVPEKLPPRNFQIAG